MFIKESFLQLIFSFLFSFFFFCLFFFEEEGIVFRLNFCNELPGEMRNSEGGDIIKAHKDLAIIISSSVWRMK